MPPSTPASIAPELKTALDALRAGIEAAAPASKLAALQTQVDALDVAIATKHFGDSSFGSGRSTLLKTIQENESISRLLKDRRGTAVLHLKGNEYAELMSRKSIISSVTSGSAGTDTLNPVGAATSGVLQIDRIPGITPEARQVLKVRDVLSARPTTMAVVDYVKVTNPMAIASPVPEASVKPENSVTFSSLSEKVRLIATWIPATKQVLDDMTELLGFIQSTLHALERIKTMRKAWDEGDYQALFEVIGKSEIAAIDESVSFDPDSLEQENDPAQEGCDPAEAVLLADQSGHAIKIPYVFNQLNRKLARWAFRACTSADLKLPSFALADDGVLIEHRGKTLSASDWIPEDSALTSLAAEKGLCIRYPIRMQEDLLPMRHTTNPELVPALKQALGASDLEDSEIAYVLAHQLRMEGTYILHSKTASRNGGDFDFDTICVMPSDQFPRFIAGRIAYGERFQQEKTKHQKAKSPWWNACPVAMKARGNRIGSITDLKTSCLAAGRPDLAYKLVEQLQNALDSLKHKVEIDESVVSEIRKAAMKVLGIVPLVLAVPAAGAQTTSQSQIRHIETSLNHLTVLEFGEPVTTLAIADPDSFQVERHDDKVFVKPLKDAVSTNLFVWTASRELSYELDPAGQLAAMDVLVRTAPAGTSRATTEASAEPSDAEIRKIASLVLAQTMMGVEDIAHDPAKRATNRVEVNLEQVYRAKDRLYIRYSVTNLSKAPFRVTTPDIDSPLPTAQPISLLSLKDHQISPQTFAAFKAKTGASLEILQGESTTRDLAPGEKATGVVSVGHGAGSPPQIFQLNFGTDQTGPLKVQAVL